MTPTNTQSGEVLRCPECGSTDVARIVFGYPSSAHREALARHEIALGGCRCYGDLVMTVRYHRAGGFENTGHTSGGA